MSLLRFAVVAALLLAASAGALLASSTVTGAAGLDNPASTACFKNAAGLGVCGVVSGCLGAPECDASTPCASGQVCVYDTCCASSLGGICVAPAFANAACSNAEVCGTYTDVCSPVRFDEEFAGGLGQLAASSACGSGSSFFGENACADSPFAPSPLAHAAWGSAVHNCSVYASSGGRVLMQTGAIDVSSCPHVVLDYDYLVDFLEPFAYDRAEVTLARGGSEKVVATNTASAATTAMGCAGAMLPVGRMVADGQWHHMTLPVGPGGGSDVVTFYGETIDGSGNSGEGFFVDDVRLDCGDLVWSDDFEGGNLWRWSAVQPTLAGYPIDTGFGIGGGSCPSSVPNYVNCDAPGGNCFNAQTTEGAACISGDACGGPSCASSADCGAGFVCVTNSCCAGNVCAPDVCDASGSVVTAPSVAPALGSLGTIFRPASPAASPSEATGPASGGAASVRGAGSAPLPKPKGRGQLMDFR